jgi:hypothetical protein
MARGAQTSTRWFRETTLELWVDASAASRRLIVSNDDE